MQSFEQKFKYNFEPNREELRKMQLLDSPPTDGHFVRSMREKINMATYIRSASWIYLVLKLIKQHFNEQKLCNI